MEQLKELLKKECNYVPSDEVVDSLLRIGVPRHYKDNEIITAAGAVDANLYIVKEGIIRASHMNGDTEHVVGFGTPGNIYANKHSFTKMQPSYYEVTACCPTTLLVISNQDFQDWIDSTHEGTKWMMCLFLEELYFQEQNNSTVQNGRSIDRLESLMKNRAILFQKVRHKWIASYLRMSPEYLSSLLKKIYAADKS